MKVLERYGGAPEGFLMEELDAPLYSLVRDNPKSCWHYIIGRMGVYKDPQSILCSLGLNDTGELICGFNFSKYIMLSLEARKALFRYLCLRFSFGHLSSVGERLKEKFGKRIFDTAACLAIDQEIDLIPLWMDGFIVPGIHLYDFPEGKDTEWYCELLKEREDKRKAETAQQISSMQDMMKSMMQGANPNDPTFQQQMQSMFGNDFKPDGEGWELGDDDDPYGLFGGQGDDTTTKTVAPPDTSPDPEDMDTPGGRRQNWNLNKPPDWIKNGKIDQEKLKQAIAAGEVDPEPFCDTFMGLPPEIADLVAKKVLLDTVNHTDMKVQGWFKGEAEQFIEFLLREPVLGWITLLRRKERTHITRMREPTRRRPSRRHPAYWGRHPSRSCKVYVFIDTSGSMGERELACVAAELHGLSSRGSTVFVGQVDADVQQEPKPFDGTVPLEQFFGRGGTDFRPAFDWLAQQVELPDFVVYFTDGAGTAPTQLPPFLSDLDVLWVLTDEGMSPEDFRENVCNFGDVVVMDTQSDVDEVRFNRKSE